MRAQSRSHFATRKMTSQEMCVFISVIILLASDIFLVTVNCYNYTNITSTNVTCLNCNESSTQLDDFTSSKPAPIPDMSYVCLSGRCIRKCCAANQYIVEIKCVDLPQIEDLQFSPQIFDPVSSKPMNINNDYFEVVYGRSCDESFPLDPFTSPQDQYFLLPDGTLYVPGFDNMSFNFNEYCMEWVGTTEYLSPVVCVTTLPDSTGGEGENDGDDPIYLLYPIGMMLSIPFLLATFVTYALIDELRNLHGQCIMSYVACLAVAYTVLSVVQLDMDLILTPCIAMAFVVYFAFFASFFWLNVMCFDIWWTFSGLRPLHGSVKERERKKFIMYSTYAWGSSLVMLIICTLMDQLEGISEEYYVRPNFGKDRCWFGSKHAELAYFYGPIGLILTCNILLFILTALKIMKLRKETAMLKEAESKRHEMENNRQQFNLYLKLFIIMGVNWTMEIISFAVGGPKYLWYITDIGNTLQGVLIFVIFVWKEKVRHLLRRRLCPKLSRNIPKTTSKRGSPTRSFSSTNITHKTSVVSNGNPDTSMRMSTLVHLTEDSDVA